MADMADMADTDHTDHADTADHRPDVYFDPTIDRWVYRASRSGACVRALVAQGIGYAAEEEAHQTRIFGDSANQGNLRERLMLEDLENAGYRIIDTQPTVEMEIIKGSVIVRGHCDAILEDPNGNRIGWEAKSMSERRFATWIRQGFDAEEFEDYAFQASMYQHALDLPMLYSVRRRHKDLDELLKGVVSVDDIDEVTLRRLAKEVVDETIIREPIKSLSEVRKKIIVAETWRRRGELPPCNTTDYFMCPFMYLHDEEVIEGDDIDEEVEVALDAAAGEFANMMDVERAAKEVEKDRKARLSPELLRLLGENTSHTTQKFRVTRRTGSGSSTDWVAVQAEYQPGDDLFALIAKHTKYYEYVYPMVKRMGGWDG